MTWLEHCGGMDVSPQAEENTECCWAGVSWIGSEGTNTTHNHGQEHYFKRAKTKFCRMQQNSTELVGEKNIHPEISSRV